MLPQLLIEFFSAFLGFFFAMLLAGMSDKHAQKKKYRLVLDCLQNELADLADPLEEYVENKAALHYPIATPVWDAMQNEGMVLELVDRSFFNDLIGTFSMIKAYNEDRWHEDDRELVKRLGSILESIHILLPQIETERRA